MSLFVKTLVVFLVLGCRPSENSDLESIGDVDRMKQRADGKFDVVCKDGRKEVVTRDDILRDRVCQPKAGSLVVSGGRYKPVEGSYKGSDCRKVVKPFYNGKKLLKLRLRFSGKCSALAAARLTCASNKCHANGLYRVELLSNVKLRLVNLKNRSVHVFEYSQPEFLYFSGIKTNLTMQQLTGWKLCYKEAYYPEKGTKLDDVMAKCKGKSLLLGCKDIGSDKILLAAMADKTKILTDSKSTVASKTYNGTGWYRACVSGNYCSIGFAKAGDPIKLNSTDYGTSNSNLRMSWWINSGMLRQYGRCVSGPDFRPSESGKKERFVYYANIDLSNM